MTAIGFVLLVLGVLVLFLSFNPFTRKCSLGEGIGFTATVVGFLLMFAGIAPRLWEAMS